MTLISSTYDIPEFYIGTLDQQSTTQTENNKKFNLCSISKLVTSILFLKMLQKNKLKLENLVKITENYEVSIEKILRHLSGIHDNEQLFLPNKSLEIEKLKKEITINNEGEVNYSDHGFMLLQFWLEEKFNCSFSDLVKKEIFIPLGLESMCYVKDNSDIDKESFTKGYNKNRQLIPSTYSIYPYAAACGLWSNGPDLLMLIKEICNGFNGYSKLGISKNNYLRLVQPFKHDWLGLGCFLEKNTLGIEVSSLGWGEGYQSMVVFYPELSKGLVVLTNQDLGVHQMKGFCGDIYHKWLTFK